MNSKIYCQIMFLAILMIVVGWSVIFWKMQQPVYLKGWQKTNLIINNEESIHEITCQFELNWNDQTWTAQNLWANIKEIKSKSASSNQIVLPASAYQAPKIEQFRLLTKKMTNHCQNLTIPVTIKIGSENFWTYLYRKIF